MLAIFLSLILFISLKASFSKPFHMFKWIYSPPSSLCSCSDMSMLLVWHFRKKISLGQRADLVHRPDRSLRRLVRCCLGRAAEQLAARNVAKGSRRVVLATGQHCRYC